MIAMRRAAIVLLLALPGCNGGPEPSTTSEGSSTTGALDTCMGADECPEAFCVAPWDAELGQRGAAECVAECIAVDDLTRFCIDDASCCEGARCNRADGLCAPESAESSGTSGTGSTSDASSSDGGESSSSSGTTAGR
jgi:hypothetical protein